jgi:hypothetical protein
MTNQDNEWEKLCEEHEVARDAESKAMGIITYKFKQIAQEGSGANPTIEELDEWEAVENKLQDVRRRMNEFIKANT